MQGLQNTDMYKAGLPIQIRVGAGCEIPLKSNFPFSILNIEHFSGRIWIHFLETLSGSINIESDPGNLHPDPQPGH